MSAGLTFPLFSGYGIELEYMIVDRDRMTVLPIADRLLRKMAGHDTNEIVREGLGWSNEFVKHVIEVKNRWPQLLMTLPRAFQAEIKSVNRDLESFNARLMPSAMHPWMNPARETELWSGGDTAIYDAYQRIFDVRTHGWANLQSMHINLPFNTDAEFTVLHAAVRMALPIIPALAASSPIADGRITGHADYRMQVYRHNADDYPSIAGKIIPELVNGRDDYHARILAPMFDAVAADDPEGVLRHEWLNSRGAIPRFDRNAIEIRITDMQECPRADISIAAAVVALVKVLYYTHGAWPAAAEELDDDALAAILFDCVRDGEAVEITDSRYLSVLGVQAERCTGQALWRRLIESRLAEEIPPAFRQTLQMLLRHGTLSRRMLQALDGDLEPHRLRGLCEHLCSCLHRGEMFVP